MNRSFKKVIKISPFISVSFISIGLIMGILSVFNQNVILLTSALLLIVQSVILAIFGKMYREILGEISLK